MATVTQRIKTALSGYIASWNDPDVQEAAIKLLDQLDADLDNYEYEPSTATEEAVGALDEAMNAADEQLEEAGDDVVAGDEAEDEVK